MLRRSVVLGIALLVSGCIDIQRQARSPARLDGLLAFEKPDRCDAGPALEHLLKTLLRDTTEEPVVVGPVEVPSKYQAALGKPQLDRGNDPYTARVSLGGTWLGLPMHSVSMRGYRGGDGAGFGITVRASRAAFITALKEARFNPPAKGERQASSPQEGEWWGMTVISEGGLTSLECSLHG